MHFQVLLNGLNFPLSPFPSTQNNHDNLATQLFVTPLNLDSSQPPVPNWDSSERLSLGLLQLSRKWGQG